MTEGVGGSNKTIDRAPTKWVIFLRDKKYIKNDKPYVEYVCEPREFQGTVVGLASGETKIGKKTFPTKIIVLQNGKERYGFNLPIGSYFYVYLTDLRKIELNKNAKISYLGIAERYNIPNVRQDAHLIKIEPLE